MIIKTWKISKMLYERIIRKIIRSDWLKQMHTIKPNLDKTFCDRNVKVLILIGMTKNKIKP